jgi:hypothetical protein
MTKNGDKEPRKQCHSDQSKLKFRYVLPPFDLQRERERDRVKGSRV